MNRFTVEQIIEGVRQRDNCVLNYIYLNYYTYVKKLVVNNKGSEDDAKDIFQEAIIIVFKNIRGYPEFKLTCGFSTYIYSIARLLWLKHMRNIKGDPQIPLVDSHSYIHFEEPKPFNDDDLKYALYQKIFLEMPPDCQQIIKLSNSGLSQKEIADKMGCKSENYISKRKHFCKEFLISRIKEDREYKEIK